MQINEVTQNSKKELFESMKADKDHTFTESTLKQIAEAVTTFDNSQPAMTVDEAREWLKNA